MKPLARHFACLLLMASAIFSTPCLSQQLPPQGSKLYVIWGHSEAGGHDLMETAPPVTHGDRIWVVTNAKKEQNIEQGLIHNPPANTFGSRGPSPNNYFADQLISEGKASDVVLLECGAAPGGADWRVIAIHRINTGGHRIYRVSYPQRGSLVFVVS